MFSNARSLFLNEAIKSDPQDGEKTDFILFFNS